MLCALALLALPLAARAGAGGPSAPEPPSAPRLAVAANVSAFALSGPARGGSLRGSPAPSARKFIAHGDAECSGRYAAIQTAAQCAAAAQALWPTGLLYPCWYPTWAEDLTEVDEPDEPQGCLLLTNADNGCGLRFNAAGRGAVCDEPGLSCVVVCGEGGGPATSTEGPAGPATTDASATCKVHYSWTGRAQFFLWSRCRDLTAGAQTAQPPPPRAMLRALALLALPLAARAGAGGPSAPEPPSAPRLAVAANVSAFALSGPARGGSLRGSPAPSARKFIAHGDAECSGRYAAIQTAAQCAAAAQALWPTGLLYPCWYPTWAEDLTEVDEPDEPQGCLLLTNADNGCGLRFNAAGRGAVCDEPGLSCVVVCGEGGGPATSTEGPAGPATTESP
ncbi:unnamed protein product [Prorocentrum cordatum]|uniref:Uncharacterized protein n=1 Tax=Prorocentrum cordatum TaxID=2364126 RepID=A0ABN9TGR3_9DINO|nr:unnamed protein product [Polarella glacialis]